MLASLVTLRLRHANSDSSCPIGQPLADDAPYRRFGALLIIETECGTGIVPEIKFSGVAVQMPLVAMLIDADHAALEDAVEALNRVGADLAASVFLRGVMDRAAKAAKMAKRRLE